MDEERFKELCALAHSVGWVICVPQCADDDELPGLVIGEQCYVDAIMAQLPERMALPPKPKATEPYAPSDKTKIVH